MTNETMRIGDLPAVLYGGQAERVWLYVHGRYGCKEEGEPFARIVCPEGWQVLAIDLPEHGARRGGPAGDHTGRRVSPRGCARRKKRHSGALRMKIRQPALYRYSLYAIMQAAVPCWLSGRMASLR